MLRPIDRDLAVRAVMAEAGNQSPQGKAAVASVIRNRMIAGTYGGHSAQDVVLAKNQFEPFNHFGTGHDNDPARFHPSDPAYQEAGKIVDAVMTGQLRDPTGGATHFYAPVAQAQLAQSDGRALTPAWAKGPHVQIGGHMFFNPDDPNGLDLSQSFGRNGQQPQKPFAIMGGEPDSTAPLAGDPRTRFPTHANGLPNFEGMTPQQATQAMMGMALQGYRNAAAQPPQPQHGAVNTALFGQQGWQGAMANRFPNGLLSGLFNGQQQPVGQPTQLPGAYMNTPPAMQRPMPPQPGGAQPSAVAGNGGTLIQQLLASLLRGGNGAAAA